MERDLVSAIPMPQELVVVERVSQFKIRIIVVIK